MDARQPATPTRITHSVARLAILLVLCAWLFWPEISRIATGLHNSSETAHVLIIPLAILLLIYHRRDALRKRLTAGSAWGMLFVLAGIVLFGGALWPFNYGYVRDLAVLPVLAGVILIACGRGVLKLSVPMLLLVLLAIPISSRLWASLIIRPETYNIAATAGTLDLLPGIDTQIQGVDIFFSAADHNGCVALGQSNRGVRLPLACLALGVFVVFSRIRSPARIIIAAAAAVPIVLFCTFFRLLCSALMTIYGRLEPQSDWPRSVSAVCALLAAYGLFAAICAARLKLFVADEPELHNTDTTAGDPIGATNGARP